MTISVPVSGITITDGLNLANATGPLPAGTTIPQPNIVGTTTNNNATAGSVGEYISSSILVASKVALTSTVAANITSISLTAGDWDVTGTVVFEAAATTTVNTAFGAINTVSATIPAAGASNNVGGIYSNGAGVLGAGLSPLATFGPCRISLSATTTVYLVASSTFAVSTCAAYGFIGARRVR